MLEKLLKPMFHKSYWHTQHAVCGKNQCVIFLAFFLSSASAYYMNTFVNDSD